MSTISRAISNTFYLICDWFVIMVLGYVFWIALAKLLSPADVGMFSTISNVAIFLSTFSSLGFNNAATKIVSQYLAKGMVDYAGGVMRFMLKESLIAGLLVSFIFLIAIKIFFPSYLDIYGIISVIAYLVLSSLYLISQGYLLGIQDTKKIFLTDLFNYFVKIVITVALIFIGFGYFGPVIGFCFATFLAFLWRLKSMKINEFKIDVKEIWNFSLNAMVGNMGGILFFQTTVILLGVLGTMAEVGIFTLVFMLTTPIRATFQSVSGSISPLASGKWTLNEKGIVEEMTNHAVRYSIFLTVPILLIIIFYSEEILLTLTRQEYLVGAGSMMIISLASLFFGLSYILFTVLYSIGEVVKVRNMNLAGGVANAVLCVALIPLLGIVGASSAYFFASVLAFAMAVFLFRKKMNMKIKGVVKIIISSLLFYLIILLSKQILSGVYSVIFGGVFGIVAYFLSLIYLGFFEKTDMKVLSSIELKIPRLRKFISFLKDIMKNYSKEE